MRESEFFHTATGGRSSCCIQLMGQSVCCHCFNKLQAADGMTFVNLSGLVTWQNLLKPHTLVEIQVELNYYCVKSGPVGFSKLRHYSLVLVVIYVSQHNKILLPNFAWIWHFRVHAGRVVAIPVWQHAGFWISVHGLWKVAKVRAPEIHAFSCHSHVINA